MIGAGCETPIPESDVWWFITIRVLGLFSTFDLAVILEFLIWANAPGFRYV